MENKPKDPMVTFRSTMKKKNSKGGDWLVLYMNQEQAGLLAEQIMANIENPKGVKLDIHTNKKEHEGRTFDSSIAFVKAVQDMGAPGASTGGGNRFKPAPKLTQEDMKKKMEALKAAQVKG